MEKQEKAWMRRGLFALVSNRRSASPLPGEDPFFPDRDGDALPADETEASWMEGDGEGGMYKTW